MMSGLTVEQRLAVKRLSTKLRGIVQMNVSSYTNVIGPHAGEITDAPTLRELEVIEAFYIAFGIKFEPWRALCRAELRRFRSRAKYAQEQP